MLTVHVAHPFGATFLDYPDDKSHAVSVYMMGCDHHCESCQNPEFRNISYAVGTRRLTLSKFRDEVARSCSDNETDKVVLTGGDPLSILNLNFTHSFLEGTKYQVCVYTGYDVEHVKRSGVRGFTFLKCGAYLRLLSQISEKTDQYLQFASQNQKLYSSDFVLLSSLGRYYFPEKGREL